MYAIAIDLHCLDLCLDLSMWLHEIAVLIV